MNVHETEMQLSVPATERDHVRGSLEAPVVIVEHGDYECPECGRAYWIIKDPLQELEGEVALFSEIPPWRRHWRSPEDKAVSGICTTGLRAPTSA